MSYDPSYRRIPPGYTQPQWPPNHYQSSPAYADAFDGYPPQSYDAQWPHAGTGQRPEPPWDGQNWNGQNWNESSREDPGWNGPAHTDPAWNDPAYASGGLDNRGLGGDGYGGDGYGGDGYDGDGYGGGRHAAARPPTAQPHNPGVIAGALMGLLAAATAIGIATLAAAFFRPQASPIIAVGEAFIDRTPPALKNFAVEKFGENDKTMLLLGMYVTIALLAMTIGVLARKRVIIGIIGVLAFGLFGSFVAYTRPASKPSDVIPSIIGGIAGVLALLWLARASAPEVERSWLCTTGASSWSLAEPRPASRRPLPWAANC
jgi:hypothetical protein